MEDGMRFGEDEAQSKKNEALGDEVDFLRNIPVEYIEAHASGIRFR